MELNQVESNSSPSSVSNTNGLTTGVAEAELRAFVERIERLEEEKAGISGDIKDIFAELKGRGFDAKAVRAILKLRKQDRAERQEHDAIVELYCQALGLA